MIFVLIFLENCLLYDDTHDFSVWIRTGSNPADINKFRSHTAIYISCMILWTDERGYVNNTKKKILKILSLPTAIITKFSIRI